MTLWIEYWSRWNGPEASSVYCGFIVVAVAVQRGGFISSPSLEMHVL